MALVGACMLTNPFYFSTQLKSCQNTAYYRSPQKQQLLKLLHQLVCPACAWWLLLERHCFFFQTSFQLLLQALYCFWEEEDMETLYIHCAHYEPLMSLAKDNLPSLGSFLCKRYCTERRKDEASLWMSLELPALLSECKATTMPMVINESYLPLSMDYTNVHSSASALALLPGPLNYLSTGFHLETFRGGGA